LPTLTENTRSLLRLTLTPGLGPRRTASLVEMFGSATAALSASPAEMRRVRGIGEATAAKIARGLRESMPLAEREIEQAERLGAAIVGIGEPGYPPLLAQIPDPPAVLYILGELRPQAEDRYPAAIVGSRACTSYGIEQAERFAGVLAGSGVTVVSGGARGIDSAAHRGAMRSGGRTIAVLGCGLAHRYPPENASLFEEIIDGRGALVSELPTGVSPIAENFPARNRIISGLALGVVVIEAARGSGALITARTAVEEQGREVLAVPGRVDSPASEGTHALLQSGGAALAVSPGDVLELLKTPALHHFRGNHDARYADPTASEPAGLWAGEFASNEVQPSLSTDDPLQAKLLEALDRARSPDDLATRLGVGPAEVRTAITLLEIRGAVRRVGALIERRRA
jgi:DNA processing protein